MVLPDNDDFLGRFRREQEPIATLQAHVSYTFRPGLWLAADATYYAGGRTTVNGVQRDDRQENTRVRLTFSLPIAKGHSLKLNWSEGVTSGSEPTSPPLELLGSTLGLIDPGID